MQEEVARQQAQVIPPGIPPQQPQPTHAAGGHQHMPQNPGGVMSPVGQYRGPHPQMSPTPRVPAANAAPTPLRHPSLPGMDQIQRYPGMQPARPPNNNAQIASSPNIMLQQQPQPNQPPQQGQNPQQPPQQQQQPLSGGGKYHL